MAKEAPSALIDDRLVNSLEALRKAYLYAVDAERTPWDFALTLEEVVAAGVGPSELRWLMSLGWIRHGNDRTSTEDTGRCVRPRSCYVFDRSSCFTLTEAGMAEMGELVATAPLPPEKLRALRPLWDADRHELRIAQAVVKRFRCPAINQEAVLAAFQEEGWSARIDDPLPPAGETDPKRRLSDTIKCLNRNQQSERIRFRGDGTGEGVVWTLL